MPEDAGRFACKLEINMDQFLAWLSRIIDSWKFWIVIAPWEIGVRIRLGKQATALVPGVHFRVPFVDAITLVNTRLRIEGTPPITVAGKTINQTRYIVASIGFKISDPLKAMMKYGCPGPVVISRAQTEIAKSVDAIMALERMRQFFNGDSGIEIDFVAFVEDVEVKTFRLINASAWMASGHEAAGPNARY